MGPARLKVGFFWALREKRKDLIVRTPALRRGLAALERRQSCVEAPEQRRKEKPAPFCALGNRSSASPLDVKKNGRTRDRDVETRNDLWEGEARRKQLRPWLSRSSGVTTAGTDEAEDPQQTTRRRDTGQEKRSWETATTGRNLAKPEERKQLLERGFIANTTAEVECKGSAYVRASNNCLRKPVTEGMRLYVDVARRICASKKRFPQTQVSTHAYAGTTQIRALNVRMWIR